MTCHCDHRYYAVTYLSAHPTPAAGLVPEGHRILVCDQEFEKEVDLDTLIFQEGRIQGMHLYFLLVCEPRFAELGLGSTTASTSRRADKTSTSAIRIQNSPFFSQSADNSSRHNDVI